MLSVKKIDNNLIFNEIERGYENRNECVKVLINNTDKIYNLKSFSEIIICTYDLNYSSIHNDMRNKSNYIKKILDNANTIFYVTQNDEFEKCFPDFNFVYDVYQNNNLLNLYFFVVPIISIHFINYTFFKSNQISSFHFCVTTSNQKSMLFTAPHKIIIVIFYTINCPPITMCLCFQIITFLVDV